MPQQRRRRQNKRNGGRPTRIPQPMSSQQISSEGVLQLGQVILSRNRITRVPLRLVQTGVQSDAGGNIAVQVGLNNPSACTNWAGYAALYDQYRVKNVIISIIPDNTSTSIAYRPLYLVTDYDSNSVGTLTTADICIQYQNTRVYDIMKPLIHKVLVPRYTSTTTPLGWLDVASPSAFGITGIIAFSLAASTQYLAGVTIEWDCEFRSTR